MAHIVEQEEAVNADSFLDIVASVVSVMIIMVMMTGLKIKNTPPEALPTSEVARAGGDLLQKQQRRADASRRRGKNRHGDGAGSSPDGHAAAGTRYPGPGRDRARSAVRGARQPAAQQSPPDGQLAAKVIDARNRLEILNRQREAIEKSPAQSVRDREFHHAAGPHGRRPRGALSAQPRADRLRAVERTGREGRGGSQAQGLQTLGAARIDRHRAARAGLSPDLYHQASSADDGGDSANRAASGPGSKTASS